MEYEKIEEITKEICKLICIPGIEMTEIPDKINSMFHTDLSYEEVLDLLSTEYMKNDLNHGRRLCCK
jgi:hypothetical protein